MGYLVVDLPSVINTHFNEVIMKHAPEILGRQMVQAVLDSLKEEIPSVVEEVTNIFSLGDIKKVLQNLLSERVSIRNMRVILGR